MLQFPVDVRLFAEGNALPAGNFRGVRMDSDERMRPDSQRGFAPIVRGIAQSNAMVSISQLGQEIYQTNVPPGPFVIDDLYPTGVGGDLLVTIPVHGQLPTKPASSNTPCPKIKAKERPKTPRRTIFGMSRPCVWAEWRSPGNNMSNDTTKTPPVPIDQLTTEFPELRVHLAYLRAIHQQIGAGQTQGQTRTQRRADAGAAQALVRSIGGVQIHRNRVEKAHQRGADDLGGEGEYVKRVGYAENAVLSGQRRPT